MINNLVEGLQGSKTLFSISQKKNIFVYFLQEKKVSQAAEGIPPKDTNPP